MMMDMSREILQYNLLHILLRVTVVDKNKAVVCCLLATSVIILPEKKKRKRKIWSKRWYLNRIGSLSAMR
jgi:hypothetical protein